MSSETNVLTNVSHSAQWIKLHRDSVRNINARWHICISVAFAIDSIHHQFVNVYILYFFCMRLQCIKPAFIDRTQKTHFWQKTATRLTEMYRTWLKNDIHWYAIFSTRRRRLLCCRFSTSFMSWHWLTNSTLHFIHIWFGDIQSNRIHIQNKTCP